MLTLGLLLIAVALLYRFRRRLAVIRSLLRSSGRVLAVMLVVSLAAHAPGSPLLTVGLVLILIALVYRYRVFFTRLFAPVLTAAALGLRLAGGIGRQAIRLRIHLLAVILAIIGIILYIIVQALPSLRRVAFLPADHALSLRIGMSLIGFALGYVAGLRLQHTERSSPVFFGLAGGVLFFMATQFLVALGIVALAVLACIFLMRNLWPTIHATVTRFAENAGGRFRPRTPDFPRQLARLREDHDRRVAAIKALGLEESEEQPLLEEEHGRYLRKLHTLSAGSADSDPGQSTTEDIQSWFEPPQSDIE